VTEAEWLACAVLKSMLRVVWDKAGDRKLRLFAIACCRRYWHLLHTNESHNAVEVAERYVEGMATELELLYASDRAYDKACAVSFADAPNSFSPYDADVAAANSAWPKISQIITNLAEVMADAADAYSTHGNLLLQKGRPFQPKQWLDPFGNRAVLCGLLHEIMGNPFRPVSVDPTWLMPTVAALATAAYTERELPSGHLDANRLVVLSDALEEIGCTNAEILTHLRGPAPHVRGCWAIDLLLGKS